MTRFHPLGFQPEVRAGQASGIAGGNRLLQGSRDLRSSVKTCPRAARHDHGWIGLPAIRRTSCWCPSRFPRSCAASPRVNGHRAPGHLRLASHNAGCKSPRPLRDASCEDMRRHGELATRLVTKNSRSPTRPPYIVTAVNGSGWS
jgi:hypothetical protein